MRLSRLFLILALALALVALAGCPSVPPAPEKPLSAINNSDVYRLAQDAVQPIADQYVERGDRILLVQLNEWYGSAAWRFVPVPQTIPSDIFENQILPTASSKLAATSPNERGENRELKVLKDCFQLDAAKKVYNLNTASDSYNELLLGRILMAAGYSGVESFSLADFAKRNPYFIDSFESGLLGAVLKKAGKGFERLETASIDADAMTQHAQGKLVFGTDLLAFASWKDVQKKYNATKLLVYSVNDVIESGMEYIGMQVSFRFVDIARGGKLLWSGSRTVSSSSFPKGKIPSLGGLQLTLPASVAATQRDTLARELKTLGIAMPMNAILLKIDDIPVFGTYPVTREDFVVDDTLHDLFASIPGVNIVEKLQKRSYKQPWQIAHSVHYIDPLLGGDYAEFQDFYGARYMIGYRVLWRDIQGVQLIQGQNDLELSDKILGIYVKVIDMGDGGKTIVSDFLPIAPDADLTKNILYRCYNATRGLSTVAGALHDAGVIAEDTHTALVNRRMEIANTYIGEGTATDKFMINRMKQTDVLSLFRSYYDVYEVIRTLGTNPTTPAVAAPAPSQTAGTKAEAPFDQIQEMNLSMAVNLMQSWFEDGLCTALSAADMAPNEKMDSLYSRSFLTSLGSTDGAPGDLPFLSPVLLGKWGPTMKSYYNIDKIIYFSLLETGTPAAHFLRTPTTVPLARYFPIVTSDPDSLQVSVVNVTSGDYEFKKDFALK